MYTVVDYKTKKALKEALASGVIVEVYQEGLFGGNPLAINGTVFLEGPHYPKPHSWYAQGVAVAGVLTKVS